ADGDFAFEDDRFPGEARGEANRIAVPGRGDGGSQRTGAAVMVVGDRQHAGDGAILQVMEARHEERPRARGPATGRTHANPGERECHFTISSQEAVCYTRRADDPGAQTGRLGLAWPVRTLLGGEDSPAALVLAVRVSWALPIQRSASCSLRARAAHPCR